MAGRPTKFRTEYVEEAKRLCLAGAIDADLAKAFHVSVGTIATWKYQFPEFLEAIRVAKPVADTNVEDSLYRRAMGYTRTETELKVVGGKLLKVEVERYYPPDTTAMIFWLKNRKSSSWSETQKVEHTGTVELADRITRARKNAAPTKD